MKLPHLIQSLLNYFSLAAPPDPRRSTVILKEAQRFLDRCDDDSKDDCPPHGPDPAEFSFDPFGHEVLLDETVRFAEHIAILGVTQVLDSGKRFQVRLEKCYKGAVDNRFEIRFPQGVIQYRPVLNVGQRILVFGKGKNFEYAGGMVGQLPSSESKDAEMCIHGHGGAPFRFDSLGCARYDGAITYLLWSRFEEELIGALHSQ